MESSIAGSVVSESAPPVGRNPAKSGSRSNELSASIETPLPSDPVEAALADALRLASQAGQWTTVEVLSREFSARRLARTAPGVPTLKGERARREQKR